MTACSGGSSDSPSRASPAQKPCSLTAALLLYCVWTQSMNFSRTCIPFRAPLPCEPLVCGTTCICCQPVAGLLGLLCESLHIAEHDGRLFNSAQLLCSRRLCPCCHSAYFLRIRVSLAGALAGCTVHSSPDHKCTCSLQAGRASQSVCMCGSAWL